MPNLDLPLDQLLLYRTRNPKPVDFDAYWTKALAELAAIDPKPQLTKAAFQVRGSECFELTFTSACNARVYAKYLRPAKFVGKLPTLLEFHGFPGHSGDWRNKTAWTGQGFAIASLDCRVQGGRSQDLGDYKASPGNGHLTRGLDEADPQKLHYRNLYLDTVQLARVVMGFAEVDSARLGALGGSQGGGLALACASLVPQIKRVAPVFPFLCDWKRVWDMDLAKDAYGELRDYFRRFDPHHARQTEIFTRLGYIDVSLLSARITAETLMAISQMDPICPPSTQFAAYNAITAPKSYKLYVDYGHENLPGFDDATAEFFAGL